MRQHERSHIGMQHVSQVCADCHHLDKVKLGRRRPYPTCALRGEGLALDKQWDTYTPACVLFVPRRRDRRRA